MTTLLRIDASARLNRSITRDLADRFLDAWKSTRPDSRILTRDVGQDPPPMVTQAWISAAFTAPEERTEAMKQALFVSEILIDELQQADGRNQVRSATPR